jgi:glyoxylase-like metal-dependent hydrolase (beta-lactamase superfamily II)
MLKQIAEGVLIHESEFIESNAVVVQGEAGVLLIDVGITSDEMIAVADDLRKLGRPVVAGFSTHPHWDHLLWNAKLGEAPRYGTARCAAEIHAFLSNAQWKDHIAEELPPEIEVPLDLLGLITGLPTGATQIPWDGPMVRIIEHQAHAPGHAALLIAERRVLVVGDTVRCLDSDARPERR